MMKKVSGANHDHRKFVVNMLACVTIQEPMMLVLEYATHGDLLTYLRNSREGVRSCQLILISLSLGALVSVYKSRNFCSLLMVFGFELFDH